ELVGDFDWVNSIAQRLGHSAALWVERPAGGRDATIGRPTLRPNRTEQGRVKPSAMLITAFQVEISRPGKSWLAAQHRCLARTRLEPHVNNVHLLAELGAAALRTLCPRRQDVFCRMPVPGVGALPREQGDHRAIHRLVVQKLIAPFALKQGDRDAPNALARDAPVGPRSDHVRDALLPPSRVPG